MTRIILIQDCDYDRQYQEAVRFLAHWHEYPTQLKDIPDDGRGDYNYLAPQDDQHSRTPKGKRVI